MSEETMAGTEYATAVLLSVLGQTSASPQARAIWTLVAGDVDVQPEVKLFKDIAYHSVANRGLSLQYESTSKGDTNQNQWTCRAIDIYNREHDIKGWGVFPHLPVRLLLDSKDGQSSEVHRELVLDAKSTGTELVSMLVEPHRKGGGEPLRGGGASGLGPPAWMEWSLRLCGASTALVAGGEDTDGSSTHEFVDVKLMVQLAGPEARGPLRWEKDKGGAARWGVATLYM